MKESNTFLFYCIRSQDDRLTVARGKESDCTISVWRPCMRRLVPPKGKFWPFAIWWILHHARVFRNRDYSVLSICKGEEVIHRTCIFPGYFRFPFMANNDLQIGDVWTALKYRRRGFAACGITSAVEFFADRRRRFWYITDQLNVPSIRTIEKVGFRKVGEGERSSRLGMKLLGSFVMKAPC